MKYITYLRKFGLITVLLVISVLAILQYQKIVALKGEIDYERENMHSAYLYILNSIDLTQTIASLEAILAPDIKDIPAIIKEANERLDEFTTALLQLNGLRHGPGEKISGALGYGSYLYRLSTARQVDLQEKIIQAQISVYDIRPRLEHFDGNLPARDKEYLEKVLAEVKKIDERLKYSGQLFVNRSISMLSPENWYQLTASLDDLAPMLDNLSKIKREYTQWKPVKFSKAEAEAAARKALQLDRDSKLVPNKEEDAGFFSLPGETTYQYTFQKEEGEEIVAYVSAATGRITFYYDNGYARFDEYGGKPFTPELKKILAEVAQKATAEMGERMVIFPSSKVHGAEDITVVALKDGIPDLSNTVGLWINASKRKVYRYNVQSYAEKVPATSPRLSPEEVLPRLKEQKMFLWSNFVNPKYLADAKVEDLVITYSRYLDKAVLAYEVTLSDPDRKVLYVNAESGKLETVARSDIYAAMAKGVKIID